MTPNAFDLIQHTFKPGATLIEASAGTGKTYSIAMLVVRLIVEQNIPIEKILVVTFTKAATEELKARIRTRLVEARDHFQGANHDKKLTEWCQNIEDKALAQQRLALALANVDQAGIFTIHSFCQRTLSQFPLESQQSFVNELTADIGMHKARVLKDFWRQTTYCRSKDEVSHLLDIVANIPVDTQQKAYQNQKAENGAFLAKLGSVLNQIDSPEVQVEPSLSLDKSNTSATTLENWQKQFDVSLQQSVKSQQQLTTFFQQHDQPILAFISHAEQAGWIAANKINKTKTLFAKRLQDPKTFFDYFATAFKKAYQVQVTNFLAQIDLPWKLFHDIPQHAKQVQISLIQMLIHHYFKQLAEQLNEHHQMSFDDLILRLAEALNQGQASESLITQIQQTYQAAFVDEFQDTDQRQWQIFSQLFNNTSTFLYLIGDPKQAIYKFRGADIFAYLQAKKHCQYHYTLDTNWRSTPSLVAAINQLFTQIDDPFLVAEIEEIDDFPFCPVKAGRKEPSNQPSFHFWQMPLPPEEHSKSTGRGQDKKTVWKADPAKATIAQNVVADIAQKLSQSSQIDSTEPNAPRAKPQDFAILVRGNQTAADYQATLRKHGIPAVINARQSVFQTEQALELLRIMRALAEPNQINLAKQALSSPWFATSGEQFLQDEENQQLEQWLATLNQHHQIWLQKGFMAALYQLINAQQVRENLAKLANGERQLTNIFHLIERIQSACLEQHFNLPQTLSYLEQQIQNPPAGEDDVLRLETDEDAVQVVTMHASKGLQYKYVYCPELWKTLPSASKQIIQVQEQGTQILDLGSEQKPLRQRKLQLEAQSETMRLLYVALTRAEEQLFVVFGDNLDGYQKSALYHLLQQSLPAGKEFQTQLLALSPSIAQVIPKNNALHFANQLFTRNNINTRRRVFSFSGLVKNSAHEAPTDKGQEQATTENWLAAKQEVSNLPKGAEFGNLVHDLLEQCTFQALAQQVDPELKQQLSSKYGVRWSDTLPNQSQRFDQMLQQVVTTPLSATDPNFTLANIAANRTLKEMAFFYAINPTHTEALNRLLLETDIPYSPIAAEAIEGYLNGFIDLVVEYQGKFYVMDYKTNYLGNDHANYHREAMQHEMTHHSYGLQFILYSLALHQYLQTRIVNYDYQQHFGGVKYLFVRGMDGNSHQHGVYSYCPPVELIQSLQTLISFKKTE